MSERTTNDDGSPASDGVTVYGATWCHDTKRSRALLERVGVAYSFVDIDRDNAAGQWVERHNGGGRSIPVIVLPDGTSMTEPGDEEVATARQAAGSLN